VIWSDESSFTLFPTSGRVYFWRIPKEAVNPECLFPTLKHEEGSVMVWAAIMVQHSVGPLFTHHGQITARDYVDRLSNQVYPMIQTLFPNTYAVFQDDNAPIHAAGTVQSWVEENEGELQHLPWPSQSPHLYITEPLWSVLGTRMRNIFPSPTSLKQLEDFLQEEWYKILLETVQNFYVSIPRRTAAVLEAKYGAAPY
jgi:hypothetical protein